MIAFHLVIGNRDKLQFPDRTVSIWELIDGGWPTYLTSLVYADQNGANVPADAQTVIYDCGAWSYIQDEYPRYSPPACWQRYDRLARPGDIVIAPDHMILPGHVADEAKRRQVITKCGAYEFIYEHAGRPVHPMAVIHGQTLGERLLAAQDYLDVGYRHLAIGGIARMASGSRRQAIAIVEAIAALKRQQPFHLHVLGISAPSFWDPWAELGVDSFDGTGPFRAAFYGCYLDDLGREYSVEKDGRANTKNQPSAHLAPSCDCLACDLLARYNITPRSFGSNEHNMGRAIHNVNMYLRRFRAWRPAVAVIQAGLL